MQKRGISPLIATVLIIGFTVALAAIFMTWGGSFTKSMLESTEKQTQKSMICTSDVSLDIEEVSVLGNKLNLLIENIGKEDIVNITVMIYGSDGSNSTEIPGLVVFSMQSFEVEYDPVKTGLVEKVKVFPSIILENEKVVCSNSYDEEKVYIFTCLAILKNDPAAEDGIYIINPTGKKDVEVYCDMTTDGGGWTRVDYSEDLPHLNRWTNGDAWRWLDNDFTTVLSKEQIQAIQSISTEGKQRYDGICQGVLHYYYNDGSTYAYAFGFRFLNGDEIGGGQENMGGIDFSIVEDGCAANSYFSHTIWDINDVRVPIINVKSRDNGNVGEMFGSELTNNPAWLR